MPKEPPSSPNRTRAVEVLAFSEVQLLDVTGPLQVFAYVAASGGAPPYTVGIVAKGGESVTASAGVGLLVQPLPTPRRSVDTLIVAGGDGVDAASADAELVA